MKSFVAKCSLLLLVCITTLGDPFAAGGTEEKPESYAAICKSLTDLGRFDEAIAMAGRTPGSDHARMIPLRLCRMRALIESGRYPEALQEGNHLQALVQREKVPALAVEHLNLSCALQLRMGTIAEAAGTCKRAVQAARTTHDPALQAKTFNNMAIAELQQEDPAKAVPLLDEGLVAAEKSGCDECVADLNVSYANALLDMEETEAARKHMQAAYEKLLAMGRSRARAKGLLVVGNWYAQLSKALPAQAAARLREEAALAYSESLATSLAVKDDLMATYAAGGLGRMEELDRSYPKALEHTRMAMLYAQKNNYQDVLYLWQWQGARILRAQGLQDEAVDLNRLSVETLQGIKSCFSTGKTNLFNTEIKPVYSDFAELLLAKASREEKSRQQETLQEVIRTVDLLRSDELKDYLRDACAGAGRSRSTSRAEMADNAAVLYFLAFDERIEGLLKTTSGIKHFTVATPISDLVSDVVSYRNSIEKPKGNYLERSQKLYNALIRPVEADLKGIETLVVVPDGVVRLVPVASLHDGQRFLTEKVAVETAQVVAVGAASNPGTQQRVLAGGISRERNGYSKIPYVEQELAGIHDLYGGKVLINDAFRKPLIFAEVQNNPYNVLHIASHGIFSGDVDNTYIVTWDGKMYLDDVGRMVKSVNNQAQLDMLALSACSTAYGDERASLGLAGIGLKAGARSVIGSLWDVDDKATSMFFTTFYKILKQHPSLPKAEILRKAQLSMLRGTTLPQPGEERPAPSADYSNPYYWGAFIVVVSEI